MYPLQLHAPEDLDRQQLRLLRKDLGNHRPKRLRFRRPADASGFALTRGVDVRDGRFSVDALNRPEFPEVTAPEFPER